MDQEKKPKLTPVFTLLENAVKTWWKNLRKIITVYLWGLVFTIIPLAVVLVLGIIVSQLGDSLNFGVKVGFFVIIAAGVLVAIYFSIRTYISVFVLVKNNYEGNELAIFKATQKLFWPYLGLTVLSTVFILLWTLLLIIPGIIYSVFYALAVYAFFFEDKRGMAAIRRSVSLVSNYWWPVFGRFMFLGVLVWVFSFLVAIPSMAAAHNQMFLSFWNGVMQVINFLIGPIVLLYTYQIYQDLVKIKK